MGAARQDGARCYLGPKNSDSDATYTTRKFRSSCLEHLSLQSNQKVTIMSILGSKMAQWHPNSSRQKRGWNRVLARWRHVLTWSKKLGQGRHLYHQKAPEQQLRVLHTSIQSKSYDRKLLRPQSGPMAPFADGDTLPW